MKPNLEPFGTKLPFSRPTSGITPRTTWQRNVLELVLRDPCSLGCYIYFWHIGQAGRPSPRTTSVTDASRSGTRMGAGTDHSSSSLAAAPEKGRASEAVVDGAAHEKAIEHTTVSTLVERLNALGQVLEECKVRV